MKAYHITNDYTIDSLTLADRDDPKIGPNQVLVRINAVSLNYRDLLVIKGIEHWKPPVGRVPVSDGAGTVVETGAAVRSVKLNDRVAGLFHPNWQDGKLTEYKQSNSLGGRVKDGLLQEYVVFDEQAVIPVPDFLSDEAAATLPCAALTAWHGLVEKGNAGPGSTVLIQGTGGVSLFSLQFARMLGARVILLSGSDEKLSLAANMGAHHLINYRSTPHWEQTVLDLTDGAGVDHIVEVVGADHINRSIDVVAREGTISVIGLIDGLSGNVNTAKIMNKQIRLQGIEVGSKAMFERMNKAIDINKIQPIIHTIYPFSDAREALTGLEQSTHFGKICIRIH